MLSKIHFFPNMKNFAGNRGLPGRSIQAGMTLAPLSSEEGLDVSCKMRISSRGAPIKELRAGCGNPFFHRVADG
jgi:hypothetical protein